MSTCRAEIFVGFAASDAAAGADAFAGAGALAAAGADADAGAAAVVVVDASVFGGAGDPHAASIITRGKAILRMNISSSLWEILRSAQDDVASLAGCKVTS